jgi:hypothetical protein
MAAKLKMFMKDWSPIVHPTFKCDYNFDELIFFVVPAATSSRVSGRSLVLGSNFVVPWSTHRFQPRDVFP